MMRKVTVAATQMTCSSDRKDNMARAEALVKKAAIAGANIILLQELFETPYFCQKERVAFFKYATRVEDNPAVRCFSDIAGELGVVLPISFFETVNNVHFNSLVVIDADGTVLDIYRKTHIPDGPGYEEKFYFSPGDTGFKVWDTRYGTIGAGICWDQWFPETARCLALAGAELIFFPTAIGSEPEDPDYDSKEHWQTCMQGHSAANMVPVITSNRIGKETLEDSTITFYGASFITDNKGQVIARADRKTQTFITAEFDLDALALERRGWGIFRDRRPEMYHRLLTLGGSFHTGKGLP